jgi:hypothetical protein
MYKFFYNFSIFSPYVLTAGDIFLKSFLTLEHVDANFVTCTYSWGRVYPKIIFFVKPSTTKKIFRNVFTSVREGLIFVSIEQTGYGWNV